MIVSRPVIRRAAALAVLCAFFAPLAPARSAGEPYEIQTVLPLTGIVASLGNSAARTLAVIETETNATGGIAGRPIKFVIADDQSNPTIDVQLVSRIVAGKAPVMLGPELTASCGAITALVTDGPVVMCMSPGAHPEPGTFMFSAAASNLDVMIATAHYAKRRNWKRIAMLYTTDASGVDGERVTNLAFAAPDMAGVQIVSVEHYGVSDLSVAAQLARIKAAAPDALDVYASGTPSATALRAIQEIGLDIPIITSYSNATGAQMAAFKDYMPKELLIAGPPALVPPDQLGRGQLHDAVEAFYRLFQRTGSRPDVLQALAWDSAHIMIAALRKLGPNATAGQIRTYIANLRGFAGVTGTFDFQAIPQHGLDWKSAIMMTRWDPAKGTFASASPIGG